MARLMNQAGGNAGRASRISTIFNRYYQNIRKQKSFQESERRAARLLDNNPRTAGRVMGLAYSRQYTRSQYMRGVG